MPSFSSGIPLLGLVHVEGEGEAITSSWLVCVGTLSSTQFLEIDFYFYLLQLRKSYFCGFETTLLRSTTSRDQN
jgi:hypothetical protein